MARSRKKVVARQLTQDWVAGYLPVDGFLRGGQVELLALDGKTLPLAASDLKWICFVRDFNSGEVANPERLLRKTFAGRPRTEGLMVRLRLADGDLIEGLAANNAELVLGKGIFLAPPDGRSNTQRIWIPPSAIREMQILAVIAARRPKEPGPEQESLFS
ncbi:MAG: hypothetical protein WBD10_04645 [Acidobacteriaceae bacterium]